MYMSASDSVPSWNDLMNNSKTKLQETTFKVAVPNTCQKRFCVGIGKDK